MTKVSSQKDDLSLEIAIDIISAIKEYPVLFTDICKWCRYPSKSYAKYLLFKHLKIDSDYYWSISSYGVHTDDLYLNLKGMRRIIYIMLEDPKFMDQKTNNYFTSVLKTLEKAEKEYVNPFMIKLERSIKTKKYRFLIETDTKLINFELETISYLVGKSKYEVKRYFEKLDIPEKQINLIIKKQVVPFYTYTLAETEKCIKDFSSRLYHSIIKENNTFQEYIFTFCDYDHSHDYFPD